MRTNSAGIGIIRKFEGLRQDAYLCPANVWTIGYGHTGSEVIPGLHWTIMQCEKGLLRDLESFEKGVVALLLVPVTSNQFSALISFAYNLGLGSLKSSTLLKLLNKKEYNSAALEFPKWVKGGGKVLPGLVARREAEQKLFRSI